MLPIHLEMIKYFIVSKIFHYHQYLFHFYHAAAEFILFMFRNDIAFIRIDKQAMFLKDF